jgi:arylsulfatase A-like enzyme
VTSDNGGLGSVTNRAPLRGCKGTLDEGGIRVPLLVRWRGHVTPGVCDVPVHHVDLFPTLAALTGAPLPPGVELDGEDLSPLLLRGETLPPRALFWHFPAYLEGKSDRFQHFRTVPGGAVRRADWKLIEYFEPRPDGSPWIELYDLRTDPRETNDLAPSEPERAVALRAELAAWRDRTGAAVPSLRGAAATETPR